MFNKMNKNSNLKKSIFAILSFVVALTLSCGIMFFIDANKSGNQQQDLSISEADSNLVYNDPGLSLSWEKDQDDDLSFLNKIQPLAEGSDDLVAEGTVGYTITYSAELDDGLKGGTTITLTSEIRLKKYILKFSGGSEGTAVFEALPGYDIDKIQLGNCKTDGSEANPIEGGEYSTSISELTSSPLLQKTTEEIDPDYKGKITFKAVVAETPYTLKGLVYFKNEGKYELCDAATNYSISVEVDPTSPSTTDQGTNFSFVCWRINTSNVPSGYTCSDDGSKVTITKENECSLELYHSQGQLTGVKGWGTISWGSGVIYAEIINSYWINVTNTHGYWSGCGKSGAELLKLCGVSTNASGGYDDESWFSVDYRSSSSFIFTGNQALTTGESIKTPNKPYNYGHYITGYYVKVTSSNSDYNNKYLSYKSSSQTWSVDSSGKLGVTSAANLNTLAVWGDGISGAVSFEITPAWEAVNIKVTNDRTQLHANSIGFGGIYNLNSPANLDMGNGQTFFCYSQGEGKHVANGGVWNYTNLDYTDANNNTYSFEVDKFGLDNVYKIYLDSSSIIHEDNKYILKNDGDVEYSFANDVNKEVLTYNDFSTCDSYNNQPLISTYIDEVLEKYISDHNTLLNSSSSPYFTNVYYSTGSVSGKTLTAENPSLWIYRAHNREIEHVPQFDHDYAQIIAWNGGNYSFTTEAYENRFSNEIKTIYSSAWVYGLTRSWSPVYVYRTKLYYEAKSPSEAGTNYSTMSAQWFAGLNNSALNITVEPEDEDMMEGKAFVYWMFNEKAAEDFGYDVESDDTIVTVTGNGVDIKFTYADGVSYDLSGNAYYLEITKIQGIGLFKQNSANPILKSYVKNPYTLQIDNSNNIYWSGFNATKEDASLYGAVWSGDVQEGITKTISFNVSDDTVSNFPFQHSENIAFHKKSALANAVNSKNTNNDYYFVYNYGHYISAWIVECNGYYFEFDGTDWKIVANSQGTTIDNLKNNSSAEFDDLARLMDRTFINRIGEQLTIKLTPVWEKTTINVLNTENGNLVVGSFNYAYGEYSLDTSDNAVGAPDEENAGQTFFCYAQGSKMIATSGGIWNYYENMNHNPNTETIDNPNDYVVEVTRFWLDNIYKISLYNMASDKLDTDNCDYTNSDSDTIVAGNWYGWRYFNQYGVLGDKLPVPKHEDGSLIDEFIADKIDTYIRDYNSKISTTNSFNILTKVFNDGTNWWIYLANNQSMRELPMFVDDFNEDKNYVRQIAWFDNNNKAYLTAGYDMDDDDHDNPQGYQEELTGYTVVNKWSYSSTLRSFNAVYVYRLKLYYENSSNTYSSIWSQWFGKYKKLELSYSEEDDPHYIEDTPARKIFDFWIFNEDVVEVYYSDLTAEIPETESGTIELTDGNENALKFDYSEIKTNPLDGNKYYHITTIQGTGRLVQGVTNTAGEQFNLLTARYSNEYDFTFDNEASNSYWNSFDKTKNNDQLFGAYSTDERDGVISQPQDDDFKKTTITVAKADEYAYPFQTTSDKAFYYGGEIINENNLNNTVGEHSYWVYNYGYEIVGWTLETSEKYLNYSGSKWLMSDSYAQISTSNLSDTEMNEIAELLDDYYVNYRGVPSVTLIPVWEGVSIKVNETTQNKSWSSFKFESKYVAGVGLTEPDGKALYALDYNESPDAEALIVPSNSDVVWNYKNIPHGEFGYNQGVYTIDVAPVWIDNIYKIKLSNVKLFDVTNNGQTTNYVLENTDYEFANDSGNYNAKDVIKITFKDYVQSDYSYASYEDRENTFVDDYMTNYYSGFRTQWNAGIDGNETNFDILRKVYYSSGIATTYSSGLDKLETTSTPTFWMYLANDQITGNLPMFKKEHYVHIYWKNMNHEGGSGTCPSDCSKKSEHYLYTTSQYNVDLYGEEIKGYKTHGYKDENEVYQFTYKWNYSDGYNNLNNQVTFEAFYFRKSYRVSISTLFEERIERHGFVYVYIYDTLYEDDKTIEDAGGNYIIIADDSGLMHIYKIRNNTNELGSIWTNLKNADGSSIDQTKLEEVDAGSDLYENPTFRLYGGCDIKIHVKDQSKESEAMLTGKFDEMVGYKFNGQIVETCPDAKEGLLPELAEGEIYDYDHEFDKDTIEDKDYVNNSEIHYDVHFEKIKYVLTVSIDNSKAGEIDVNVDDKSSSRLTTYELKDFVVGTYFRVNYHAYAGFKLQNEAFIYYNRKTSVCLQKYDDNSNVRQDYVLTKHANLNSLFDAPWLREYFYHAINGYSNFDVNEVNLGTLTLKTETIQFNFGIKVYDETGSFIETFTNDTLALNSDAKITTNKMVGDYLTKNNAEGFWYYHSNANNTDYALINSRLFVPNNYLSQNRDYGYIDYDFLLKTEPAKRYTLNPTMLASMVDNYSEGTIIPVANRNLYYMLEVRKLLTVTVKVDAINENDSNDSTRLTTISTGKANVKNVIVEPNAVKLNDFYILKDVAGTTLTFYTYYGLNVSLSPKYDENRYSGVEYYLGTSADSMALLSDSSFALEENEMLEIYYIPKGLNVEFKYKLDGNEVELSQLSDYISEDSIYKPSSLSVYNLSDKVSYVVSCVNDNYNIRVKINGTTKGVTNNEIRQISLVDDDSYTIESADFNKGVVEIEVEVFEKDGNLINVNFQLRDVSKRFADDKYGTYDVYTVYNGETEYLVTNSAEEVELNIIEAKDVYVVIKLNAGYEFVGYKHSTSNLTVVELDQENKFLMIDEFDPDRSFGDYLIYIDKISITANLNVEGLEAQYQINGKTNLKNLYVGSTIEFTNVDVDSERLKCFYYWLGADKVYLTENGNIDGKPLTNLKITSALLVSLNSSTINFGVEVIKRYKLDITLNGQDCLSVDGYSVNLCHEDGELVVDDSYISGTYYDEGTTITFKVEPSVVGKYNISVVSDSYDETFDVVNFGDIIIALNKNHVYSITVTPKEYNIDVEEYVYETLDQIQTINPSEVLPENMVNNMSSSGQSYNETAVLEFTRNIAGNRVLYSVVISNNDMKKQSGFETIEIVFDGENYVAYADGEVVDLVSLGYAIELTESEKVKLTYKTYNNISIRLDYKDYKVIEIQ